MRIISGNTFFYEQSVNFDNDLGSIYAKNFLDLSSNYGSGERHIYSGNSSNIGYVKCAKFFESSINRNESQCGDFYGQSVNDGSVVSGFFNSTSLNCSFVDNSIFKDNSVNSGISNIAHFCNNSQNFSNLETGVFCNNSENFGFSSKSCFKDSSKNFTNLNDTKFLDNSINYGVVKTSIFNCSSINSGIVCDSHFSGSSINLGSAINSSFEAFSKNQSTNFSGIFNSASVNLADLNCSQFYRYSTNSGSLKTGIFFDRSVNKASVIDYAIFSGDSSNYGYVKTGIFYKSGKNFGSVDVFIDGNFINTPLSGFYSSGYYEDGLEFEVFIDYPIKAIDSNKYYLYSGDSISLATGSYENGLFYSGNVVQINYSKPFLSDNGYWFISGLDGFGRAGLDDYAFYPNGVFRNGELVADEVFYSRITGSGNNCYYLSGQYLSGINGLYSYGCFDNAVLNTSLNIDLATPIDSDVFWSYKSGIGSIASGLYYAEEAATIRYTGGVVDNSFESPQIEKAINADLYFGKYYDLETDANSYTAANGATTLGWFNLGSLSVEDQGCEQQWMDIYDFNYSGSGDSIFFAKSDYDWNFYACYSDSQTGVFSGYSNLNAFKINPQIQEDLPLSIWHSLRDNDYLTGFYSIFNSGHLQCAEGYFSSGYFADGCLMTTSNTGSFEIYDYPLLTPQIAKNIQSKNCYYTYADKENIILNAPVLSSGLYSNGAFLSGDLVSYFGGPLIPNDTSGETYYRYNGLEISKFTCSTPLNTGNDIWFTYSDGVKSTGSGYYSNGYISGGYLTGVTGDIILQNIDSGTYSLYRTDSTVQAIPDGLTGNSFYVSGLSRNFYKTNFDYQSNIYSVSLDLFTLYFENGTVVNLQDPVLNTGNNFYSKIESGVSSYFNDAKPQIQNGTGFIYINGYRGLAYGYFSNGFFGGIDVTGGYSQPGIKTGQYRADNPYDVIQATDDNLYYKYNYAANLSFAPAKYHAPTPSIDIIDDGKYHTFISGTESLASGYYSNGVYESGTKLDYFDFLYRPEIFSTSRTLLDLDGTGRYLFTISEDNSYQVRDISAIPYWSNSVSNDWYSLSNWYSNSGLSMNLGYLPSAFNNVFILGNSGVVINLDNPLWVQPNSIDTRLNTSSTGVPLFAYSTEDKHFSGIIYGDSTFSGVIVE